MQDAIIKGNGNSRYLKTVAAALSLYPTYEDFLRALVAGNFPIDLNGINEAGWTQQGTPLNKANLLPDTLATSLGLPATATVADALSKLLANINTVEADGVKIEIVSYVGTGTSGASVPCSITASGEILAAVSLGFLGDADQYVPNIVYSGNSALAFRAFMVANHLETSYKAYRGFMANGNPSLCYGKKSSDGKTFQWYYNTSGSPGIQLNQQGGIYYFLVFCK